MVRFADEDRTPITGDERRDPPYIAGKMGSERVGGVSRRRHDRNIVTADNRTVSSSNVAGSSIEEPMSSMFVSSTPEGDW